MSPTVSHYIIFITIAIEAYEGCNVVVIDLPGAFLHTEMDEHIIVVPKGQLAEMMALVEPKLYMKYIMTNSNGQLMMYMKMQKTLYGLLGSILMFYKELVKDLKRY